MPTFEVEVDQWIRLTERRMNAWVSQTFNDVAARASRTATGKTRGGSLKKGFVPRDVGTLAASAISSLQGGTAITSGGPVGYAFVAARMRAGDVATIVWTAPYAQRLHYESGWMWVDETAQNFQAIAMAAARRVIAQTGGP